MESSEKVSDISGVTNMRRKKEIHIIIKIAQVRTIKTRYRTYIIMTVMASEQKVTVSDNDESIKLVPVYANF